MFYISGYFTYDVLDMYFNNRLLHDWGVTLHHLIVSTFSITDSFKYTKKKIPKHHKCDINHLTFIALYPVTPNNDVQSVFIIKSRKKI